MKSIKLAFTNVFVLLVISTSIKSQEIRKVFSVNADKMELLANFLGGQKDSLTGYIKWEPTIADILEYHGELGDGALYSKIDTFFDSKDNAETKYLIYHTISMIEEDGIMKSASNCHSCAVNMGYISFTKDADSLYYSNLRRNFATHGSFGRPTYKLYNMSLGDGYDLIRIDDFYDGMGVESIASVFYDRGDKVLSMTSGENNSGNRDKGKKGYYEYKTKFSFNKTDHTVIARQTGYNIDEITGKKTSLNKTKKWKFEGYTKEF